MENLLPIQFLEQYEGEKEVVGRNHNQRIIELQEKAVIALGLSSELDDADEIPWCSLAVIAAVASTLPGLVFEMKKLGITARAKSWLSMAIQDAQIEKGDIVIFSRGVSAGHVGFVCFVGGSRVQVLGGNQSNSVCRRWYERREVIGVVKVRDWLKNLS